MKALLSKVFLASVFIGAVVLSGCGAGNPMVGTWKMKISDKADAATKAMASSINMSCDFKADNTYTASLDAMGQKKSMEGTYKLEGNTITMTQTKEDGKAISTAKTETATLSADKKSFDIPGSKGEGMMVKQ